MLVCEGFAVGNACQPRDNLDRSIGGKPSDAPAAPVTRSPYGAGPYTLRAASSLPSSRCTTTGAVDGANPLSMLRSNSDHAASEETRIGIRLISGDRSSVTVTASDRQVTCIAAAITSRPRASPFLIGPPSD